MRERIPHCHHAERARERPSDLPRVRQQTVGATDHKFHRQDNQKKLIRIGDRQVPISIISRPGFWLIAAILLSLFRLHEPSHAQDSATTVSTGKTIYEQHCLKCHGQLGRGDGPQAQWQMVRPTNFRTLASRSKSDDQLLSIIEHGLIFSPMHAWRDRLSPAEEEDVLGYIRQLTEQGQ